MFLTETYSTEYIDQYVKEHKDNFTDKKLVIITVCELGCYLHELLRGHGLEVFAFADTNEKVVGKKIYHTPVISYDEIPVDAYLLVSSTSTAYNDKKDLNRSGFSDDSILVVYPDVIEYFREGFEKMDRENYAGLTKEQNDQYLLEEMRGSIEVKSLPTMLILDLTTRCNLNCRHCEAHHDIEVSKMRNREENYMKPSRYKQLIEYANSIYLNISGEPLLTKKFWEVLDYVDQSDNDPNLFTVTNGMLLNQQASDRIVASKFKVMIISMDAATKKTYGRLRGGDFDLWYKNVKYLVEAKNKASKNLRIVLQHTISREALEETEAAILMAEELGVDEISIRPLYTDIAGKDTWIVPMDDTSVYFYPQQDVKYYPHLLKEIIERSKKLAESCKTHVEISGRFEANLNLEILDFPYPCSIEQFKELQKSSEHIFEQQIIEEMPDEAKNFVLCDGPWNLMMIFTNGNIMYCNRMAQAEGNLNFSSIYDLRNSKTVHDIRKGLVDNDISWHCYYCSGCSRSDYSKHIKRNKVFLNRGDMLNFAIDDTQALKKVKYHGLSRIQRNGTFNNLNESTIEMYLAKEEGSYIIKVIAEAFIIPGLVDVQEVQVLINDKIVDVWKYEDAQVTERRIKVDAEDITEEGRVVLGFHYPNAVSPLSFGIGRDDRKRALFIHKITIE